MAPAWNPHNPKGCLLTSQCETARTPPEIPCPCAQAAQEIKFIDWISRNMLQQYRNCDWRLPQQTIISLSFILLLFKNKQTKKSLHRETEQLLSWVSTGARQSVVCLCVQDYYRLRIVSSEKRDSPWFRSEVLNQRKKNSCNSTELTSKHLSALHLIQHKSEHSTDASTNTGAAEGPVQRFIGFFALFCERCTSFPWHIGKNGHVK